MDRVNCTNNRTKMTSNRRDISGFESRSCCPTCGWCFPPEKVKNWKIEKIRDSYLIVHFSFVKRANPNGHFYRTHLWFLLFRPSRVFSTFLFCLSQIQNSLKNEKIESENRRRTRSGKKGANRNRLEEAADDLLEANRPRLPRELTAVVKFITKNCRNIQ